jgi:L-ascorbate metabolism protein UlaG (beta-lactamase superfamily)
MKVTYYGHSCFGIKTGQYHLLFDPFITYNELAKGVVDLDSIPADYILVSHAHQDHIADLLPIAKRTGATIIGIWEIHDWAQKNGITQTHPMNIGGKWQFEFGTVQLVNAIHSSSFPDGSYGGAPVGFVVQTSEKSFYYSGDTALFSDMQLIARNKHLDFAFLCIGDNFTMNYDDAILAAKWVNVNKVIGMHYDTFGYIKIDHEKAIQSFKSEQKELVLMKIGSSIEL